ncbi:tRNA lysidine(34) synthetase TilS [Paenibacillus sp. GP183]|uniref:tRNA lysidine(34) synthetase TilS n=1 Tax=Paenibacillus sp. GP183 TaxID=1882751 RepID=UPI00089ADAAA|nr:tRNA lysidine(34) synthetase TilS [Paenibacillus sp. GP183]SEC38087.1 tRNA(Ile)-lysidine synthase [Paenibacillus sp. GP183]
MNLLEQVERRIKEHKLLAQGDAVVVAVSGGPDSVALLHILFLLSERHDWKLAAAHVNHQFRGEESDSEAVFVANLAQKWGIPCEVAKIDVPAYIEQTSLNAQTAAREKRYEFLHAVARQYSAKSIALAHHADDQAETILMRLIRGTGPSGLTGMQELRQEKKVELIRPFLRIYKSDIEQHCLQYGLSFCRDSSNELRKYFRNQIRLDVMPLLRSYNDQLPESLNRLAEMMQAEDDYMESAARQFFTEQVTIESRGVLFSRQPFARLHVALQRRLIKLILDYLASGVEKIDFTRVELLRNAILQEQTSNLKLDINEHFCLVREYDSIRFQASQTAVGAYAYPIVLEDAELRIPEAGMKLIIKECGSKEMTVDVFPVSTPLDSEAFFDLDQLELPLVVRSRAAGDRMQPYGLNGTKKVKDMFIDAKIPPSQRDAIPLIVDAKGQVLWIPGLRHSKHAPVHTETMHVLHMKLIPY